jgi:hypothetical protein
MSFNPHARLSHPEWPCTPPLQWHSSIAPCDQYGTAHKCYRCACASAADGNINRIALALEAAGIPCVIEQTGGFTMVVYVYSQAKHADGTAVAAISLTDESMGAVRWLAEAEHWEGIEDLTPDWMGRGDHIPTLTEGQLTDIAAIVKANLHAIG